MDTNVKQKSASKLWRESGTTLSFKDWMERNKKQSHLNASGVPDINPGPVDIFKVNKPLSDSISKTLNEMDGLQPQKDHVSRGTIFGINKYVLIGAGLVLVGAVIYKVVKNKS